jgi:hypothetical protein
MHGQSKVKLPQLPLRDMKIVTITPEDATALLERNKLNRPLRDNHVRRIAKQISTGKWRFNGDTIKISTKDDILDGQHRLWAVIEAKKPIETILVHGIEAEAFATIDTIRAVRTGGDVLALNGAERYRNKLSAALTWLIRWQRKCIPNFRDPSNKVENSDIEQAYKANPGMFRAVERCARLQGLTNVSICAFFYYILFNRDPDLAERMVNTLENPAGVGVNDPFFRLRASFTAASARRDGVSMIALMIKATNAAYADKDLRGLTWRNQGHNPEEFPKLEIVGQKTKLR